MNDALYITLTCFLMPFAGALLGGWLVLDAMDSGGRIERAVKRALEPKGEDHE